MMEELCSAPQWPDAGALLQLQCHLCHQVKVLVGLCQVGTLGGNVPARNKTKRNIRKNSGVKLAIRCWALLGWHPQGLVPAHKTGRTQEH
jgi:hypothetical protein